MVGDGQHAPMRAKYRDNMTPTETAAFLAQLDAEDQCFAQLLASESTPEPTTEDDQLLRDEVEEQTLDYFNRYIAGDR